MKIVRKDTEEIYEFISGNFQQEMVEVDYQQNPYSAKVRQNTPFMNFFNGDIYVPFSGYDFKNWLHTDWPFRATFTDGQVTEIVSNENYKPWYDSLFVEPKNPFYRANGLVTIYFRVIEDEARALLESMGIEIQEKK